MAASGALQRLTRSQIPLAAGMLARAFQQDPLMVSLFPDPTRRQRLLPTVIGWNVRYAARFGEVFATPSLDAVALWLAPGNTDMTVGQMISAGLWTAPLRMSWPTLGRLAGIGDALAQLHRRHAPRPHWYLSQIGVEPHLHGQGLGSTLLRPMVARFDAERLSCYLDTAEARNLGFYRRWGFDVVDEVRIGTPSMPVWALLRSPA